MRLYSKISLQWKLTLVVGVIIVICTSVFTIATIKGADRIYGTVLKSTMENSGGFVPDFKPAKPLTDTSNINAGTSAVAVTKNNFNNWSYILFFMITILGMTGVYFVIGKSLKPLKKLNSDISKINENNLSNRIEDITDIDEITNLINGFNRMLFRLDEAFKRQNRFTANAAHELKTPLATIKAGIQVLKMDDEPNIDEYIENTKNTEISINRLIKVVDNLLLLASEGEQNLGENNEIFLQSMFETIIDEIAPLYSLKNIACKISCKNNKIIGNFTLLYGAFFNLIENAYKYNIDNGEIEVWVQDEKNTLQIIIQDTGIGIPKEQLETIFEAFYRVEQSRSRRIGGSGLGLSIVKTIIENHGGTIKVSSELNRGTKFIVTIPKK